MGGAGVDDEGAGVDADVDCEWGDWGDCAHDAGDCGDGTATREATTAQSGAGEACAGDATQACNTPCPSCSGDFCGAGGNEECATQEACEAAPVDDGVTMTCGAGENEQCNGVWSRRRLAEEEATCEGDVWTKFVGDCTPELGAGCAAAIAEFDCWDVKPDASATDTSPAAILSA